MKSTILNKNFNYLKITCYLLLMALLSCNNGYAQKANFEQAEYIIKSRLVYDGLGNPPKKADMAIKNGKIEIIAPAKEEWLAKSYEVYIEIKDHTFIAPEEIPFGWTTLKLKNNSNEHHLMMAHRLPENISPQQAIEARENWKKNREPAEWWGRPGNRYGGQGLLAPDLEGHVTIFLEPGIYSLVCGFRSEDGTQHFDQMEPTYLKVTDQPNGASEPKADFNIRYENRRITTGKPVTAGSHTFRELFNELHDVQLAKLSEGVTVEELEKWLMKWKSPVPAIFLGGLEPIEPDRTAYFTLNLGPGRYVWVCSKHPKDQKLQTFIIE